MRRKPEESPMQSARQFPNSVLRRWESPENEITKVVVGLLCVKIPPTSTRIKEIRKNVLNGNPSVSVTY